MGMIVYFDTIEQAVADITVCDVVLTPAIGSGHPYEGKFTPAVILPGGGYYVLGGVCLRGDAMSSWLVAWRRSRVPCAADLEYGRSIGATYYFTTKGGATDFYKFDGDWKFFDREDGTWRRSFKGTHWADMNIERMPREEWTIYNNDKPLSELDDDEAAALFNHWRNGGQVTYLSGVEWVTARLHTWVAEGIYRADKSPRDKFIEAAGNMSPGEMFDSGKFKLEVDYGKL